MGAADYYIGLALLEEVDIAMMDESELYYNGIEDRYGNDIVSEYPHDIHSGNWGTFFNFLADGGRAAGVGRRTIEVKPWTHIPKDGPKDFQKAWGGGALLGG